MKKLALLLAFTTLAACAQTTAQPKRPMTFADLQAMKRISDPQISPSGKWVLFSVTDVSLEKNTKTNHLWVVPLDGSAKERQITFDAGESNGRFAPDGTRIALTTNDQIFEAKWDEATGAVSGMVQVTNVAGGADGAIWSPDSKRLMFTASVYPDCSDFGDWAKEDACDKARDDAAAKSPVKAMVFEHLLYRHWNAFTGDKRSHILVVDAADGRNLRDLTPKSVVGDAETPTFSLGGPLGYAWAPDSKEIAYVTNLEVGFAKPGVYPQPGESTNNDIFTLRLDEPAAKAVKVSTSPGSDDGPQYSPDGRYLAWRSQARNRYESDKVDLVIRKRAGGDVKNLTGSFDGWVDEFYWLPSMSAVVFTSADRGGEPIYLLPFQPDASKQVVRKREDPGEFGSVQMLSNGSLVATRMGVNHPAELLATRPLIQEKGGNLGGGESFMLTHLNDQLVGALNMDQADSFWFTGADGDKVQGFLIRPPNFDPAKKYPLKFLIHGGPQGAWGDAWSYRWNPELFAANGYVVVMINPRGSTGYGQKFLEQVSGDWGGRAYDDLMKGLDYAEAKYPFIDKTRECALGASYGGYMANWILTHTDRFACIVTHDGMYNPQSAFGTTEELWFNEWEFRPKAANGLPDPAKPARPWDFYEASNDADPFRKYSPMLHIKDAHTPTLVIHGQKDYRLDVSEGFQLFTALQLLGVPSKMLYFPDEGHWVLKPQNSQLWYETVNDWCDRWLGVNKYAAVGPEKNPAAKMPIVGHSGGHSGN